MTGELPGWYPLANATDAEIDSWLAAANPSYDEMRKALPWLDEPGQLDAWISGVREGRAASSDENRCARMFANIRAVPFPPLRLAGRGGE